MSTIFKPMLATDADLDKLRFPLYASPKLDGVRAVVRNGVVYSRSNKPIPSGWVQRIFGQCEHFDGELIVGDPTSKTVYRDTVSGVMSHDAEPDVRLFVFDHVAELIAPYDARRQRLKEEIYTRRGHARHAGLVLHDQWLVNTLDELLLLEQGMLEEGYEGLILRSPYAPYKMGRSTVREGYLLKLKRFQDAEAVVIGFEERMHNGNEATISELGRTKRSSHKAGKSGRGDLGALVVRTPTGVEFNIGTGFTDDERMAIWSDRDKFLGASAKYKFFPVGVKEAPRHPVFLGWRMKEDV